MSKVRLTGSTSGYTELVVPAIAGNNTLTLPAGNGSPHQLLKNSATAGVLEYATATLDDSGNLNGISAVNGGPLAGFRNAIINGNFDHWQRGTSFTAYGYGADRWVNGRNGSTCTMSRQSFALGQTDVPGEPTYFCRMAVTTVAGASNYAATWQRIEDVRSFAGQKVTVSFWAKADGNKPIAIDLAQNFGSGGSPSAEVSGIGVTKTTLSASWQKVTVTVDVPSIAGKTLGTDNNSSLSLFIWFDAGSSIDARTNSLGQQSGTFDIAQVQIEPGPTATVFEQRPLGVELRLCQRYHERCYGTIPNTGFVPIQSFATPKRVAPSITILSYLSGSGGSLAPYGTQNFYTSGYAASNARVILAGDAEL